MQPRYAVSFEQNFSRKIKDIGKQCYAIIPTPVNTHTNDRLYPHFSANGIKKPAGNFGYEKSFHSFVADFYGS
jgi:hypothetical protein